MADRADKPLTRIERGQVRMHCEIETELRPILDGMEGLLRQEVSL